MVSRPLQMCAHPHSANTIRNLTEKRLQVPSSKRTSHMFALAKSWGLGLMIHAVMIMVQPISKKWRSGLYSSKELSAYSREWSNTVSPYYALRKNRWTVIELFLCAAHFAKWV